jgi:phosphoglycolate phosphatase-like HAD superfamily hydrolase
VEQYVFDNLVGGSTVMTIMERLMDNGRQVDAPADGDDDDANVGDLDAAEVALVRRVAEQKAELQDIARLLPTAQQKEILDELKAAKHGLYVLSGGPGTGKTFLTKQLLHHLRMLGVKTVRVTRVPIRVWFRVGRPSINPRA